MTDQAGAAAAPRLTMLNSMAGSDIRSAIEYQRSIGMVDIELKDKIYGKDVLGLTLAEAEEVANLISAQGMSLHCLATSLFSVDIGMGREDFLRNHSEVIDHAVQLVAILGPRMVRLASFRSAEPSAARRSFGWIVEQYRETIHAVRGAGAEVVTIENEPSGVLASPEVLFQFFDELGLSEEVGLTWDIQNMWETGCVPTVEVYQQLRPLIRHVHLKGGRADTAGNLKWKSSLRDADWPVYEIVSGIRHDSIVDVVCLNPPHGATPPEGLSQSMVEEDVQFLVQHGLAQLSGAMR